VKEEGGTAKSTVSALGGLVGKEDVKNQSRWQGYFHTTRDSILRGKKKKEEKAGRTFFSSQQR